MMKRYLFMSAAIGFLSLAAVSAHAETSININNNSSNSSSDVKVTSTNGKSTVCINGDCKTYDGNVDVRTENGKTSVKVNNKVDGNATNSSAVDEEVNKQKDALMEKAQQKQQEFQEKMKNPFDLWNWIQGEIEALKKLIPAYPF